MNIKQTINRLGKTAYLSLTGGSSRTTFHIHGTSVYIPNEIELKIRYYIARKRYENTEAKLIQKNLSINETVIELGGALGVISKVIRNQIGENATFIVVEPNEEVVDICSKNSSATEIIHSAVAYDCKTVSMNSNSSLLDNRINNQPNQLSKLTPAITLNRVVEKLHGEEYTLICDIEGAEAEMVSKDYKALKTCNKLIMEVHPEFISENGYDFQDMLKKLESIGFVKISLENNALYMEKSS